MTAATGPDPRRWKALAVLGVAYLMVVLDISIVNVALPSIQKELHFSTENLQWVVSGYALTFGGFQIGGALGLAILTTVSTTRTNHLLADGAQRVSALTDGFRLAFWVSVGFAAIAFLTALLVLRRDELDVEAEPASAPAA